MARKSKTERPEGDNSVITPTTAELNQQLIAALNRAHFEPQRTIAQVNVPLLPIDDLQIVGGNPMLGIATDEAFPVIAILVAEGPDKPHAIMSTAGRSLQVQQNEPLRYESAILSKTFSDGNFQDIGSLPANAGSIYALNLSWSCDAPVAGDNNFVVQVSRAGGTSAYRLASIRLYSDGALAGNVTNGSFQRIWTPMSQVLPADQDGGVYQVTAKMSQGSPLVLLGSIDYVYAPK